MGGVTVDEKLRTLDELLSKMDREEINSPTCAYEYTVTVTVEENRALTEVLAFLKNFRSLTR